MIIAIGLVVLVAALVVAIAAVLTNRGESHSLGHAFTVLGHHVHGSSGALFLYGLMVGAIGLASLLLVLGGVRRAARRRRGTRLELKQAHQATAEIARDRDNLAETARQAAPVAAPVSEGRPPSEMPADLSKQHSFFDRTPPPPPPAVPPADAASHRSS